MFLKKLFCRLFEILGSSWGFTSEGILTNCVVNWALVVVLPCLGRIFPTYLLILSHVVWLIGNWRFSRWFLTAWVIQDNDLVSFILLVTKK